MSDPISGIPDHVANIMSSERPDEDALRAEYEARETAMLKEEGGAITPPAPKVKDIVEGSTEYEEEEEDELVSDDDDDEDEGEAEDDEGTEPMSESALREALSAAQSERDTARKDADGRLRDLIASRRDTATLKEDINGLKTVVEEALPKEPEVPAPDKDEDPIGYVQWQQDHVVKPLVEQVESLGTHVAAMQQQAVVGQISQALNAHIGQKVSEDKAMESEFTGARDFLAETYKKHFIAEGDAPELAAQKVSYIALNEGSRILKEGGDFVATVIATAKEAGFEPTRKEALKKVKRGQGQKNLEGSNSKNNRKRGRKLTQAMLTDRSVVPHEEAISIMQNDLYREQLMTKGYVIVPNS